MFYDTILTDASLCNANHQGLWLGMNGIKSKVLLAFLAKAHWLVPISTAHSTEIGMTTEDRCGPSLCRINTHIQEVLSILN